MKAKKFFKNKTISKVESKHQIKYSFIVERNGTVSDLKINSNLADNKLAKNLEKHIHKIGRFSPALYYTKHLVRHKIHAFVYLK